MTVNRLVLIDLLDMELGFTFSALIIVIYLLIDVIELVVDGFDDRVLVGYEFLVEKFKFQI